MLLKMPLQEMFAAQNYLFSDADPGSTAHLPTRLHICIKTLTSHALNAHGYKCSHFYVSGREKRGAFRN